MADYQPSVNAVVKSQHRVTIPKRFRRRHDITEGDEVKISIEKNDDMDEPTEEDFEELKQMAEELF